jgi:peptidoglycan/LPS O-acetylase OafA/YrhL
MIDWGIGDVVSTFPSTSAQAQAIATPARFDEGLPRILPSLTGLRFWAALLVVVYHMTGHIGSVPVASDLARFGRTGVAFFFVLSGFVLTWTYMGKETPYSVFYWRRLVRIWPLHIMTTLVLMAVYVATNNPIARELSLGNLWPAAILIHTWFPSVAVNRGGSGASWSLADEMFFYYIFPFLLLGFASIRRSRLLLSAPFVMTAISLALWVWIPMDGIGLYRRSLLLDYFPLSRVVQFISGVAIAVAMRRGWRSPVPVPIALLITIGYHLALIPWANAFDRADKWYPYSASQLFSLLPFALLIASVATNDLKGRSSHLAMPVFVLLGQASFAWYLLHSPGILLYVHVFGKPSGLPMILLAWTVVLIATQIISIAVYLRFERPLEKSLRGLVKGRRGVVFAPS